MRNRSCLLALVVCAGLGLGFPGVGMAQCVECANENIMGELHHTTWIGGEQGITMSEDQDLEHGNNEGCRQDDEPHGDPCISNCWNSHMWCDKEEEDPLALAEAVVGRDVQEIRAALNRPLVRLNLDRKALQVTDPCLGNVTLHIPLDNIMLRLLDLRAPTSQAQQ